MKHGTVDLERVDNELFFVTQQFGDTRHVFNYDGLMFKRLVNVGSTLVPANAFCIYYDGQLSCNDKLDPNYGYSDAYKGRTSARSNDRNGGLGPVFRFNS